MLNFIILIITTRKRLTERQRYGVAGRELRRTKFAMLNT